MENEHAKLIHRTVYNPSLNLAHNHHHHHHHHQVIPVIDPYGVTLMKKSLNHNNNNINISSHDDMTSLVGYDNIHQVHNMNQNIEYQNHIEKNENYYRQPTNMNNKHLQDQTSHQYANDYNKNGLSYINNKSNLDDHYLANEPTNAIIHDEFIKRKLIMSNGYYGSFSKQFSQSQNIPSSSSSSLNLYQHDPISTQMETNNINQRNPYAFQQRFEKLNNDSTSTITSSNNNNNVPITTTNGYNNYKKNNTKSSSFNSSSSSSSNSSSPSPKQPNNSSGQSSNSSSNYFYGNNAQEINTINNTENNFSGSPNQEDLEYINNNNNGNNTNHQLNQSQSSTNLNKEELPIQQTTTPKRPKSTFPFGKCKVCNDKATGVHYGIATCEGCKGFFKRSTLRKEKYRCFFGNSCPLTPDNRNRCKSCRFRKCVEVGMSIQGVKMGRIPKAEKEKALKSLKNGNINSEEKSKEDEFAENDLVDYEDADYETNENEYSNKNKKKSCQRVNRNDSSASDDSELESENEDYNHNTRILYKKVKNSNECQTDLNDDYINGKMMMNDRYDLQQRTTERITSNETKLTATATKNRRNSLNKTGSPINHKKTHSEHATNGINNNNNNNIAELSSHKTNNYMDDCLTDKLKQLENNEIETNNNTIYKNKSESDSELSSISNSTTDETKEAFSSNTDKIKNVGNFIGVCLSNVSNGTTELKINEKYSSTPSSSSSSDIKIMEQQEQQIECDEINASALIQKKLSNDNTTNKEIERNHHQAQNCELFTPITILKNNKSTNSNDLTNKLFSNLRISPSPSPSLSASTSTSASTSSKQKDYSDEQNESTSEKESFCCNQADIDSDYSTSSSNNLQVSLLANRPLNKLNKTTNGLRSYNQENFKSLVMNTPKGISKSECRLFSIYDLLKSHKPFKSSNVMPALYHSNSNSDKSQEDNFYIISSLLSNKLYQVYVDHMIKFVNDSEKSRSECDPNREITLKDVWDGLIDGITTVVRDLVLLVKDIPGLNELSQHDFNMLVNNKVFDFFLLRNFTLVRDGESYMMLSNNIQYTRKIMYKVIGYEMTDSIFKFCEKLQKIAFTVRELAILVPFIFTMNLFESNFEDILTIQTIHEYYYRALMFEFDLNKRDDLFVVNFKEVLSDLPILNELQSVKIGSLVPECMILIYCIN